MNLGTLTHETHINIILGAASSDMTHLSVLACSYISPTNMTRSLLQTEATYKGKIRNNAEYLNTKYKEDQFVNIAKSHESNQANMKSTIKIAAKVVEELYQTKERSDTKRHTAYRSMIR